MGGLISVIEGRWVGLRLPFRSAVMELVEEAKGAEVKRLKLFDDKGIVYGEPSDVEIDLLIRDNFHMVEVKARVQKSDATELLRIGVSTRRRGELSHA